MFSRERREKDIREALGIGNLTLAISLLVDEVSSPEDEASESNGVFPGALTVQTGPLLVGTGNDIYPPDSHNIIRFSKNDASATYISGWNINDAFWMGVNVNDAGIHDSGNFGGPNQGSIVIGSYNNNGFEPPPIRISIGEGQNNALFYSDKIALNRRTEIAEMLIVGDTLANRPQGADIWLKANAVDGGIVLETAIAGNWLSRMIAPQGGADFLQMGYDTTAPDESSVVRFRNNGSLLVGTSPVSYGFIGEYIAVSSTAPETAFLARSEGEETVEIMMTAAGGPGAFVKGGYVGTYTDHPVVIFSGNNNVAQFSSDGVIRMGAGTPGGNGSSWGAAIPNLAQGIYGSFDDTLNHEIGLKNNTFEAMFSLYDASTNGSGNPSSLGALFIGTVGANTQTILYAQNTNIFEIDVQNSKPVARVGTVGNGEMIDAYDYTLQVIAAADPYIGFREGAGAGDAIGGLGGGVPHFELFAHQRPLLATVTDGADFHVVKFFAQEGTGVMKIGPTDDQINYGPGGFAYKLQMLKANGIDPFIGFRTSAGSGPEEGWLGLGDTLMEFGSNRIVQFSIGDADHARWSPEGWTRIGRDFTSGTTPARAGGATLQVYEKEVNYGATVLEVLAEGDGNPRSESFFKIIDTGVGIMFDIQGDGKVSVGNRIINMPDPVDPQDASTKAYTDSRFTAFHTFGIEADFFDANDNSVIKNGDVFVLTTDAPGKVFLQTAPYTKQEIGALGGIAHVEVINGKTFTWTNGILTSVVV